MIPRAVFGGVLLKVGYDVFDHDSLQAYLGQLRGAVEPWLPGFRVTHLEMVFIIGTTLVAVFVNLNAAVISLTIAFYVVNKFLVHHRPMPDLPRDSSEGS